MNDTDPEDLPAGRILAGGCLLGYGVASCLAGAVLHKLWTTPAGDGAVTLIVWLLLGTGFPAAMTGLFLATSEASRLRAWLNHDTFVAPQAIADSTLLIALVAGLTTLGGVYLAAPALLRAFRHLA